MNSPLSWLVVDLKAIDHNIKQIKRLLAPETQIMAIVKSHAYGHGIFEVAKQAIKSGATHLGVATAEEAIELRKYGVIQPIVVLGAVDKENIKRLIRLKVAISVYGDESYRTISRVADVLGQKAIVYLKVDTGIHRLGFANGEAVLMAKKISSYPRRFVLEGLYSHLASVEELNQSYTKDQLRAFERVVKKITDQGISIPIVSLAASAATIMHPESHFNCVRIGIAMYGLWPSRGIEVWARRNKSTRALKLKPALSYKTRLVQIKRIPAGSYIGYGSTYQARQAMTIGVLPIGYFEGIPRSLSNMGFCLYKGAVLPMIGRICMNMTIVDLSKRPRAKVGDEVVIIGSSQTKQITATDIADWAGNINYEIVSTIPAHIERFYK